MKNTNKAIETINKEPVRVTGEDVREAYMLLQASKGLGMEGESESDIEAARRIVDARASEFAVVLNYVTTRED